MMEIEDAIRELNGWYQSTRQRDRGPLLRVLESDALLAIAIDRADLRPERMEDVMRQMAKMIEAAKEIAHRREDEAAGVSAAAEDVSDAAD